jgi:dTDP-4-dehydrorhamnose reductase
VSDFINQINPAIIIHAAAVSAPDLCENNPSMARAVNAEGTQNIVDAAKENKRRIVYVSTDMVFDGKKGSYSETDMPEPVNFYGKSKLEGENICLKSAAETIVVRITLQYGWGTKVSSSFSDWLIKKLKSGEKAPLFTDQYRSPTLVIDTAIGLELAAVKGDPNTVYHLAASDRMDRYAFGVALASVFKFPEDLLKPSLMRDMPGSAPRPRDVSLNGEKFIKHFNFQPRSVNEGLKAMFCQQHETE